VPHIHKGLGSVLDYGKYKIENFEHFCVQSSPMSTDKADAQTAAVRGGDMAYYYWLYPNFMLNWYEGYLDTNLVIPLGLDRCRVVFDFYFGNADDAQKTSQSMDVADRVQQEDIDICESVQRGLGSRAYDVGRLSVRREAGEHLFHRLLHRQLSAAIA
jgi:choline monooxygenase